MDINKDIIKKIEEIVGVNNVLLNEPMSKHSTFKTGGNAPLFVTPIKEKELCALVSLLKDNDIEYIVTGKGSNILVTDKGISKVVVNTNKLQGISLDINTNIMSAYAGDSMIRMAKVAFDNGLCGMEFASGIPGSFGGGVFMNAGAYSREMKDILISVTILDNGIVKEINPIKLDLSYRHSNVDEKGYIILGGKVKLDKGNKEEIEKTMLQYKEKRLKTQPLNYPNAGSTFKRPNGYFAAKLIDDAGLKGYHINDAYVSEKHGGFIVNKGNATSSDILNLIEYVKKEVNDKFGVLLEEEVRIIGDK